MDGFKDGGDQIEEIEVDGEDWKKYMELETLKMNVEDIRTQTQIGHKLRITIMWYNKSHKRLKFMTPPPLVYFEKITKITTTGGQRNTEIESVDQYERNPASNTFNLYRWGSTGKNVDPGQRLKVQFLDPPQMTITPEYKSRVVKFKIGLKGSEQWINGVQELSCDNNQIIEHDFKRT